MGISTLIVAIVTRLIPLLNKVPDSQSRDVIHLKSYRLLLGFGVITVKVK